MGTWMGAPRPWLHAVSSPPHLPGQDPPSFLSDLPHRICSHSGQLVLCVSTPHPQVDSEGVGVEKVAQDPWVVSGGAAIWIQIMGVRIRKGRSGQLRQREGLSHPREPHRSPRPSLSVALPPVLEGRSGCYTSPPLSGA